LILGNHDDRHEARNVFDHCYDTYLFKIDGKQIFASHYPARSWDKAAYGSYMLYGHVHNLYNAEDNGRLMPHQSKVYSTGFEKALRSRGVYSEALVQELLDICASINGIDLTLDVGVDNPRQGLPFGTPWSMADVVEYMSKKEPLWQYRKTQYNLLK
jgi:hypothetical protein